MNLIEDNPLNCIADNPRSHRLAESGLARPADSESPVGLFGGLFLVGLNHHTAAASLREQFFADEGRQMPADLAALSLPGTAVLLTCNRIEVYATGGDVDAVISYFADRCGMETHAMRQHLYIAHDHDAAMHLMRVAAGLDSPVIGEAQILGQVAEAAANSPHAGPVLSRLFGAAIVAGKRARSETAIGRHSLSITHAGVLLAAQSGTVFERANILIIGAGEMARQAILALNGRDTRGIGIINRSFESAKTLAAQSSATAIPWSQLRSALATADVVIAATSSPGFVISAADLNEHAGRPVTLIDLGMPRNIDPAAGQRPAARLFDIDDLQTVVERNRGFRQREVAAVERLLMAEMDKLHEQLRAWRIGPVISRVRDKVQSVIGAELRHLFAQNGPLNDQAESALSLLAHRISAKLLHGPTVALRSPRGPQIAPALCEMFGIDMPAESPHSRNEAP